MAVKSHIAQKGRTDLWKLDPKEIKVLDEWNERTDFGDLEELAKSIIANGVKVPVTVKRRKNGDYELIDGERRLKATLLAIEWGYDIVSIPAIVVKGNNEIENLLTQLLCNEGKRFTPVEEAGIYKRLICWGYDVKDISKATGKSLQIIYTRLKLWAACPDVKAALQDKEITIAAASKIVSESTTVDEQKEKLAAEKQSKPKRNEFNFDKVNKIIYSEFKKFKKPEFKDTDAKKNAINQLKEVLKELESDIPDEFSFDPDQITIF